ncbi:MAG TPA: cation:proton antiporter [Steroidobacter sp.]|nr:cation:proton antiporter [Steroidobacter sp.]
MGEHAGQTTTILPQLLMLLAFSVLVVAIFRRLRLPPIVGYLAVGMALGPYALDLAGDNISPVLAELGVVFLLFTLGLEFSLPRMVAMGGEALLVGATQVFLTTTLFAGVLWLLDERPLTAVLIGGALAMSSTAIVIRQLGEQAELNRTHARIAVGVLLFQDLAFVPLLAVESVYSVGAELAATQLLTAIAEAAVALALVLTFLRWIVRPLFHEIGRARNTELFTLAALLVSLGAAWATNAVGLSMALGAFLAGMLLAETEYRHQLEIVIRPFRDVLLGLFFITIGTLLDLRLLLREWWFVLSLALGLQVVKTVIVMLAARRSAGALRKSFRAGFVLGQGGEFGFALLTLMLNDRLADAQLVQPLLAAIVVSMVASPLLIRHNGRIADWLFRRREPPAPSAADLELAGTYAAAQREHVIICGFGRVGQNLARVLEQQGFEYIALDMDPKRVQAARAAGDLVVFGDGAQPEILQAVGLERCSVLVLTFTDADGALGILKAVRELRPDVPVLVRTQDDAKLDELQRAGATEVVPETLEASLMLVSHVLLLLDVPISRVVKTVGDIRNTRYAMLRRVFRREDARPFDQTQALREELHTVVLPPGAYSVGRKLAELELDRSEVTVTAIRRDGIVGRQPDPSIVLREGDVVVLYGVPEALAQGETRLLMG